MQKIKAYILTICLLTSTFTLANQGMWLPTSIPDTLLTLIDEAGGELEAEDLLAQVVHINCAGASKAEVHAVRELWAQAAGASKISYKGNPTVKQKLAVGGSLIIRD